MRKDTLRTQDQFQRITNATGGILDKAWVRRSLAHDEYTELRQILQRHLWLVLPSERHPTQPRDGNGTRHARHS